jgi:putative protein kinase ArgK-like GTPase of G3E family
MTQAEALEIMHSGVNVFLTGEPGAGKTYTLNKFIEEAQERYKRIAITPPGFAEAFFKANK